MSQGQSDSPLQTLTDTIMSAPTLLQSLRLLVAIVWMGSLWTIGFIVAPVLFTSLGNDKALAGTLAGKLFHVEAWLGIVCAVLIMAMTLLNAVCQARVKTRMEPVPYIRRILRLCCFMVILIVAGYFAVQPSMAHLRSLADSSGVMPSDVRHRFGLLHLWSTVVYAVESLTGLFLLYQLHRVRSRA